MNRGQVLVGILNNLEDFEIARDKGWYRIPVSSVEKLLKDRWPPEWLAFYHTKVFGRRAYTISYYTHVTGMRQVYRWELFPDRLDDAKAMHRYYQIRFDALQELPQAVVSSRWRRIVFIPTTLAKLTSATEINDLYDESPLEDQLWTALKRREISAERQEFVTVKSRAYALDFAIYCVTGKIDVETDGDTWHSDPARIPLDNQRDNDLETVGWRTLRFNTYQIQEQLEEDCLYTISENINRLGGIDDGRLIGRKIDPNAPDGVSQLRMF